MCFDSYLEFFKPWISSGQPLLIQDVVTYENSIILQAKPVWQLQYQ